MRKNSISSFIQKTWDILQDSQYQSILTWSPEGNSFLILNQQTLCSEVLPKFFKHSNFSSFIRQLNMYNFHKKKTNNDSMEFYHRLFRKDKKQLLIGIKRKPSQAEIEFGEELIRKMNKQTGRNSSRQNSQSDENANQNYLKQPKQFKLKSSGDSTKHQPFINLPQTFVYSYWMNMGYPLYEITPINVSTSPYENYEGRKILTNIIIKNPPPTTTIE